MKFLHTADLHLGKVFHEHSLIEDQRYMLNQLGEILTDRSYQALLIAGDIYDRSIPSPEAVSLFSGFLGKLKLARPDLEILIIPGNHDSSSRLGFGKELFAELGIHFVTDPEDACTPVIVSGTAFFLLPFMNPGSLRAERTGKADVVEMTAGNPAAAEPIRSQAKLAEEAAARLEKARREILAAGVQHAVLAAHLFAAGGMEAESERVFLGTAERVAIDLFANFDYTALGHLHRYQKAGKQAHYSGSPLAYSFGEAKYEKVFLAVELGENHPVSVEPIPVKPLRSVRSLKGSFNYFFRDSITVAEVTGAEHDYLEIVLTDTNLVENPLALLRKRFPWILSIRQDTAFASLRAESNPGFDPAEPDASGDPGNNHRHITEDFEDFLIEIYGEGDPDKTALFRELLGELETGEAEG
ncbi:nuclease SbcCD subunit D [Spirochaetia bacterium]|nr:nuclease SbcCD subunit D [Spirochaetia bacterium]